LEYEAERQRKLAAEGKRPVQETRGWVEEKGKTVSQRTKEHAHDYRYFPEPDLPPLLLERNWIEQIKTHLPEMPEARRNRFISEHNLSAYDAGLLTGSKAMADYFEECLKTTDYRKLPPDKGAKELSNWLLGEVSRIINATSTDIDEFKKRVSPERLLHLILVYCQGAINLATAKSVLEEMFKIGKDADIIIKERGLGQISEGEALEVEVLNVIKNNQQAIADYKAGKDTALKFLIGQVMRATRGRANPQMVNEILKRKLEEG
jgi:aspartyl-tRNA(Asn)/glutamyl-tRNA(Gln) amidotransferase subunit B